MSGGKDTGRRAFLGLVSGTVGAATIPTQATAAAGTATAQANTATRQMDGLMRHLGRYSTGVFGDGAAEIPAYDPGTQRLFVVNGHTDSIDVLDVSDPTAPSKVGTLDVGGGGPNNVSVQDGLVAAAVEGDPKTSSGEIAFFDAESLQSQGTVTAGALPDMVTFTDDGNYVLTANEGEPSSDYSTDPAGSVTIVDVSSGVSSASTRTATFASFNGNEQSLRERGIRIYGPDANAAADFEPEYIATAGSTAYVTLQENNALAVVDIENAEVTSLKALGYKDFSSQGNGLDAIDDGRIDITTQPVYGMYQPDAIEAFEVDGESYLVAANEGDAREWDALFETGVLKQVDGQWGLDTTEDDGDNIDVSVDAAAFGDGVLDRLAGLEVTTEYGDTDDDGALEELYLFGARSFSIHDSEGNRIYESGSRLEQIVADEQPEQFNSDDDENGMDSESVASGPEPEGVAVGSVAGTPHAFIGLEEISAIVAFDISTPASPSFVDYINTRDFSVAPESDIAEGSMPASAAGDLSPEGLAFASASESPTDSAMLAVAYEVSGTTSLYGVGGGSMGTATPGGSMGTETAGGSMGTETTAMETEMDTATETATDTQTATAGDTATAADASGGSSGTTAGTTSGSGPGFGALTAITGAGIAGWRLLRGGRDDRDA